MKLRIYNTLTRTKEELHPIEPGHVRMYVCGMTVYDYCHLGHARVMVAFDAVARYLRSLGYRVTYVRNITDIDDKIIARANESGEDFRALTERFTGYMHEDCRALGVLAPDVEPRATHYIGPIVAMVERLLANGAAYRGANGDVYYDVSAFPAYGALADRRLEDLRSGARVEVDEAKDDPLDFVLWKASKPGEPSWESPWGPGRPGWHIECSAMSTSCLGNHFDIHGGGMDLQFPHHENEIAQSEASTGVVPFSRYWVHNGLLRLGGDKMSKSLGNLVSVEEALERFSPDAIRLYFLSSHYRSPLSYTDDGCAAMERSLERLRHALDRDGGSGGEALDAEPYRGQFFEAMDDDLNTPRALASLFDLARDINRNSDEDCPVADAQDTLRDLGGILGLTFTHRTADGGASNAGAGPFIELLLETRTALRQARQFEQADRIRDGLEQLGVSVEDTPNGPVWQFRAS